MPVPKVEPEVVEECEEEDIAEAELDFTEELDDILSEFVFV